jgi:hypothetical protein
LQTLQTLQTLQSHAGSVCMLSDPGAENGRIEDEEGPRRKGRARVCLMFDVIPASD